jgi:hypothetical protein
MGRRGLSDGAPARFGKRREAPHGRRLPEGGEEVARAIHVDEAVRVVRPFARGDGVDGGVEVRGKSVGREGFGKVGADGHYARREVHGAAAEAEDLVVGGGEEEAEGGTDVTAAADQVAHYGSATTTGKGPHPRGGPYDAGRQPGGYHDFLVYIDAAKNATSRLARTKNIPRDPREQRRTKAVLRGPRGVYGSWRTGTLRSAVFERISIDSRGEAWRNRRNSAQ